MPSKYTFTEYSPTWPTEFTQEAQRLRTLLGKELVDIHHIGSTSVPGLAAKPIIDLMPVAQSIEAIDRLTPTLEQNGYQSWGEYGLPGRRFFTRDRDGYRTHNIHFYQMCHPDIERDLAFCAYLRSHEEVRQEYAALKRDVYARHPADGAAYNEGKDAWIKATEVIALEWYRQQPHGSNSQD